MNDLNPVNPNRLEVEFCDHCSKSVLPEEHLNVISGYGERVCDHCLEIFNGGHSEPNRTAISGLFIECAKIVAEDLRSKGCTSAAQVIDEEIAKNS